MPTLSELFEQETKNPAIKEGKAKADLLETKKKTPFSRLFTEAAMKNPTDSNKRLLRGVQKYAGKAKPIGALGALPLPSTIAGALEDEKDPGLSRVDRIINFLGRTAGLQPKKTEWR